MLSISPEESLPTELEMVMLALRPEVFSVAVTLRIPLTSTSKTTSRTASPAFIGGIGASVNSPRDVLSSQLTLSPWKLRNYQHLLEKGEKGIFFLTLGIALSAL